MGFQTGRQVDLYPVNPFKEAGGMETCVQVELKCYRSWGVSQKR